MSAQQRALAVDFAIAGTAILISVLAAGIPQLFEELLVAGLGAFVVAGGVFISEHSNVLDFVNRTRPMSLVLAGIGFFLAGAGMVTVNEMVARPAANLLWGMGIGLGTYRVWYGVINPLPKKRREQADMWGEPPDSEKRP